MLRLIVSYCAINLKLRLLTNTVPYDLILCPMIHIAQYNIMLSPVKKNSIFSFHIAQYNFIPRFVNNVASHKLILCPVIHIAHYDFILHPMK